MNILITGAFGNVGLSTTKELINRNHNIRIFEVPNKKNKKLARRFKTKVELYWGDIRRKEDIAHAIKDQDIIIHLAAIIPPLADEDPKLAHEVNVKGTLNLLDEMKSQTTVPKIIFTSSIAVYGDRRDNPMIEIDDPLLPSKEDTYANNKIQAENLIRESGVDFSIFRLTYITSVNKLNMDPLMFHMPLDTPIEICDTQDVGFALANAIVCSDIWGKTFNIAGGENCRTYYKDYIDKMMELFGLGKNFLPDTAYAKSDYHCGYMNTEKSQNLLNYQWYSLEDYYSQVKKKIGIKRYFTWLIRWMIRLHLLRKSYYYRRFKFFKKKAGAFSISENKLIRKLLSNNYNKINSLEEKVKQLEEIIEELRNMKNDINLSLNMENG
ncbi:MAG: NAD(P)-dependent oxidoreductase [Promethearchaeota archaeon]|nr:MAG: NAD(P)-dependent oxidoreductase [Candidatus Lokiarchaeota archaeon]